MRCSTLGCTGDADIGMWRCHSPDRHVEPSIWSKGVPLTHLRASHRPPSLAPPLQLQLGHRVLLSKLLLGMRACKLRGFIDEADFVATLCNWRRMAFEEKVYLAIDMLEIPLDEPMAPGKLYARCRCRRCCCICCCCCFWNVVY